MIYITWSGNDSSRQQLLSRLRENLGNHLEDSIRKMKLLDLFCGAGGASYGYQLAGYETIGVDIEPHPSYPGEFHQMDWRDGLEKYGGDVDLIHASPPCQQYSSSLKHLVTKPYPKLIEPVTDALIGSGKHWVIENVPGSPLPYADTLFGQYGLMLCGSMFGLKIRRHRLFETSFHVDPPAGCDHTYRVINPYGSDSREWFYREYGHRNIEPVFREEMGVGWMNMIEGRESIPPVYTKYIGELVGKEQL